MSNEKYTITKYFLRGNLEGMTVEDKAAFLDDDSALEWAAGVNEKVSIDYVVTKVINNTSGVAYPA